MHRENHMDLALSTRDIFMKDYIWRLIRSLTLKTHIIFTFSYTWSRCVHDAVTWYSEHILWIWKSICNREWHQWRDVIQLKVLYLCLKYRQYPLFEVQREVGLTLIFLKEKQQFYSWIKSTKIWQTTTIDYERAHLKCVFFTYSSNSCIGTKKNLYKNNQHSCKRISQYYWKVEASNK